MVSARLRRVLVSSMLAVTIVTTLAWFYPSSFDQWSLPDLPDAVSYHPPPRELTKDQTPIAEVVRGAVIMPKLGNATAKALLGQATWKLLHTMTLRFPEHPTPDERRALDDYMHLTSRLYPCGECAAEFQQLLAKYPPQTSSRKTASLWLCHVHNLVNARLKKPEYDCTKLDETYDCGCGPEPTPSVSATHEEKRKGEPTKEDDATGLDMIRGGVGR